jgi:hypothetical protein
MLSKFSQLVLVLNDQHVVDTQTIFRQVSIDSKCANSEKKTRKIQSLSSSHFIKQTVNSKFNRD